MQIEVRLPSGRTLRTNLDVESSANDLLQQLSHAGHLDSDQEYTLALSILPHTRLERLVRLGENLFFVERQLKSTSRTGSIIALREETDPRKVFVVHGRNRKARNAMFEFLRALGLHPIEWIEAIAFTRKAAPYIGEILDAGLSAARAVVVVLTGDDEVRLKRKHAGGDSSNGQLVPQARPNVIFEAGMALAKYPNRTVLVELGTCNVFSDISGRHTVRLDNSPEKRHDLALRLKNAGCEVSLERSDWYQTGDFSV